MPGDMCGFGNVPMRARREAEGLCGLNGRWRFRHAVLSVACMGGIENGLLHSRFKVGRRDCCS
jgi:hypothetical protein